MITIPSRILCKNFLNRPTQKVLYSSKILRKRRIMVFHVLLRHELIQVFNILVIHLLINSGDFPAEIVLGDVGACWERKNPFNSPRFSEPKRYIFIYNYNIYLYSYNPHLFSLCSNILRPLIPSTETEKLKCGSAQQN